MIGFSHILVTLLLAASTAFGQLPPAHWMVSGSAQNEDAILFVDPAGNHVGPISAGVSISALCMNHDNQNILVAGTDTLGMPELVLITPSGSILANLPIGGFFGGPGGGTITDLQLDQDGTLVVSVAQNLTFWNGLYRVDPRSGSVSLIWANIIGEVRGVCIDEITGDYLVAISPDSSTTGGVLRISRSTGNYSGIQVGLGRVTSMDQDPSTGDLILTRSGSPGLVRLLRGSNEALPITIAAPFDSNLRAVKVDPETGHFVLAGANPNSGLAEIRADGSLLRSAPGVMARSLGIYGARKVSALGSGAPGTAMSVTFAFPYSGGMPYIAALSTGVAPGFTVGTGPYVRQVNIDVASPLFSLSLSLGGLAGITAGFAGTLDSSGTAHAAIRLPLGVPPNLRLFLTAIAGNPYFPAGFDTGNTAAFTVQ